MKKSHSIFSVVENQYVKNVVLKMFNKTIFYKNAHLANISMTLILKKYNLANNCLLYYKNRTNLKQSVKFIKKLFLFIQGRNKSLAVRYVYVEKILTLKKLLF